ncbi:MAG: hypothetical protein ACO1O1_04395 [Adhaeribacter sp.]
MVLLQALGCSDRTQPATTEPALVPADSASLQTLSRQLLLEKLHIDALTLDTLGPVQVFTKVAHQAAPVAVVGRQYPKKLQAIYQVYQDSLGHILYLAESPYSETGDWDIVYRSYYDTQGRIFAFERTAGFYNSSCTEGALYEHLISFYDPRGRTISTERSYTDQNNTPVQGIPCAFPYNFPYEVVPDVNAYCRKINLKL